MSKSVCTHPHGTCAVCWEKMRDLSAALTASQERVKVLEGAYEPLYADGHQWSRRPCATCQKITNTIGAKFGCIRFAAEKAAPK